MLLQVRILWQPQELTGGIIKLGAYDLILCGNESADGATRQTPAQIAEFLDIPCVSSVNNISFIDEKTLLVEKKQIMAHSLFK